MGPGLLLVLLLLAVVNWRQLLSAVAAVAVLLICLGVVYIVATLGLIGAPAPS